MNKEKIKNFIEEYKPELKRAGVAALFIVCGVTGAIIGVKKSKEIDSLWEKIIPWNDSEKIAFVKKWMGSDEYKDGIAIGLRNVTVGEIGDLGKQALEAAGASSDTVIGQVLITTIKERK